MCEYIYRDNRNVCRLINVSVTKARGRKEKKKETGRERETRVYTDNAVCKRKWKRTSPKLPCSRETIMLANGIYDRQIEARTYRVFIIRVYLYDIISQISRCERSNIFLRDG